MKVPISWLREYLDFDRPLAQLADDLTMAGLEVEETTQVEDETIWNVKVTPNRGDWLSMIGVAREAAPLAGSSIKLPQAARHPEPTRHPELVSGSPSVPKASDLIKIDIEDPDLCGRYVGVVIRNVTIKPSPGWMQQRLTNAGMRPINNIVDITNYVMLELGQPLHAFDHKLVRGGHIIVRRARKGEGIVSIDGTERKLEEDMLVIADNERPVAIAGVMGGIDSEISEQTQDILLESANFNSTSIRRTSKRLGMVTESSYRFERTVDPSITAVAALRAAELMRDLGDGEVAQGMVDVRPRPVDPWTVEARPERVNAVLGTSIDSGTMAEYLNSLDIDTSVQNGILVCRVPTFRPDITREIDIAEEIGRRFGYQNLPMTLPRTTQQGKDSPQGLLREKLRRILMSCGGQEVLTHSVVDSRLADLAGRSDQLVRLRNPLSEDLDSMRTALIPNLLGVIGRNQSFGTTDICIFEIGKIYSQPTEGQILEELSVAGAMTGSMWKTAWNLPEEALQSDFFLCKGTVESLLDGLGVDKTEFVPAADPLLHPTRAARILIGGEPAGIIGEIAPAIRESLDLRERVYTYELDFEALMASVPKVLKYRQLPRYPALSRHMAVVVPDEVSYEQLARIVRKSGKGVIEEVDLLDVFTGEQIGAGRRSMAVSMVLRSRDKTLTDEEVNAVLGEVKEALSRELGASFR